MKICSFEVVGHVDILRKNWSVETYSFGDIMSTVGGYTSEIDKISIQDSKHNFLFNYKIYVVCRIISQ